MLAFIIGCASFSQNYTCPEVKDLYKQTCCPEGDMSLIPKPTSLKNIVDRHISATVNVSGVHGPHMAQVYARRGSEVYSVAHGVMAPGSTVEVSVGTPLAVRSLGKSITSMLASVLMEQGLFHLDTPLYTVIPEFDKMFTVSGTDTEVDGKSILVRHCLTEANGFGYLGANTYTDPDTGENYDLTANSLSEWLHKLISRGKLGASLGELSYGGGASTLGAFMESAYNKFHNTSTTFETLLNTHLATPCDTSIEFIGKTGDISKIPKLQTNAYDGATADYLLAGVSDTQQGGSAMVMPTEGVGKLHHALMNDGKCPNGNRIMSPNSAYKILHEDLGLEKSGWVVVNVEDNKSTFAHGLGRMYDESAGNIIVPAYKRGLRYWLGLYTCSSFMWTKDDAQLTVCQATQLGGSRAWHMAIASDMMMA